MTTPKAKLVSDVIATPAVTAAAQAQPRSIVLIGTANSVLQEATILIRQGYTPSEEYLIEVFPHSGTIQMYLIPGTPDQFYIDAAAKTTAVAAEREHAAYMVDVEKAAARQIETAKRAETQAQIDALVAKQAEELKALQATVAAAAAGQAEAVAALAAKLN